MNDIWKLDITPEDAGAQVGYVNQAMKNLNRGDIFTTDDAIDVLTEAFRLQSLDLSADKVSSQSAEQIAEAISSFIRSDLEHNFMLYFTVFSRFSRQR